VSEFEIRELIFNTNSIISDQFQFWMAATFAVVVASYTAGPRLAVWARVCVAVLYVAAVATFFLRYRAAAATLVEQSRWLAELIYGGPDLTSRTMPRLVGLLRQYVMLGGTLLAVVLIFKPSTAHPLDPKDEGA